MDLQQAFDEGFDVLKGYVDRSFDAYAKRIDALEQRLATPPAVGADDLLSVKGDLDALRKAVGAIHAPVEPPALPDIPALVSEAVAALPAPEPGKSIDTAEVKAMVDEAVAALPQAKDADPVEVEARIVSEVERVLAGWERPQNGKSVTVEELAPVVAECVQKAIAALPAPKDGRDGLDVKDLFRADGGRLVAVMSDGSTKDLGVFVGKDADMDAVERSIVDKIAAIPKPKDGKDGFSLKHFDATLMEDGRTVLLSFEDDERSFKVELGFAVPLDRGVYKEDGTYAKGDGVTWGGCFWIAQVDNPEGKPDSGKGWRMAVKKGRDGKDFVPKPDSGPPKVKV